MQGTAGRWAPKRNTRHVRKLGAPMQCKACPQVGRPNACPQRKDKARPQLGRPNATQGTSARWPPKRKTHPQWKCPHKGALGLKMRWRMDKNKFWLGGRLFNTASQRLCTPMQHKAHPQDGRPNATQGTSASWAPQCNARHIRKLDAPTHVRNTNARHVHNERHICTSAS
jgi:hypothetical protein